MNAPTILQDAYTTLTQAAQAVPITEWDQGGVCGTWSIKDIVAHMTAFEQVTVEIFTGFLHNAPSPLCESLAADSERFNIEQVARRGHLSAQQVLDEYATAYAHAQRLLNQIPPEMRQQNGTMPWYGEAYDLDDYLAYQYGHAREHAAQIDHFRTQQHAAPSRATQASNPRT